MKKFEPKNVRTATKIIEISRRNVAMLIQMLFLVDSECILRRKSRFYFDDFVMLFLPRAVFVTINFGNRPSWAVPISQSEIFLLYDAI